MSKITMGSLLGMELEENFLEFDLTEIQSILASLSDTDVIDLAHAEFLQKQTLRGADIVSEYLGKLIKTTSYLESKMNSVKNKVALNYKAEDGRTTAEMKKWAGESSEEVAELAALMARGKGSKSVLEKKYDILIKSHHYYKDLGTSLRLGIVGTGTRKQSNDRSSVADGWE